MPQITNNGVNVPDITTPAVYRRALGVSGASAASAVLGLYPINDSGVMDAVNLAAGNTVITLARMRSGVQVANSASNTSLFVPLLANIADIGSYTFDVNNPKGLFFSVQRRGLGVLAVNFEAGVTLISNNLDPSTLTANHIPVSYWLIGVNVWMEM